MVENDKENSKIPKAKDSSEGVDSSGETRSAAINAPGLSLNARLNILEKELAHAAASALELAKHPNRYAPLGASLAEGMAAESLGELVGAGIGTLLGPEGTLIGAEVGGVVGQVLGARQGAKIAKELVHQTETGASAPLTEDLKKETSARAGSHLGQVVSDMIGEALFDDAGGQIIQAIGGQLGDFAGGAVFEHVEKKQNKTT